MYQSFHTEMQPFVDDVRLKAKQVNQEVDLVKTQADHYEHPLQSQERYQASESRRQVLKWFAKSDKELQRLRQEELERARGETKENSSLPLNLLITLGDRI